MALLTLASVAVTLARRRLARHHLRTAVVARLGGLRTAAAPADGAEPRPGSLPIADAPAASTGPGRVTGTSAEREPNVG